MDSSAEFYITSSLVRGQRYFFCLPFFPLGFLAAAGFSGAVPVVGFWGFSAIEITSSPRCLPCGTAGITLLWYHDWDPCASVQRRMFDRSGAEWIG